jgi:hypothetical protein
MSRLIIVSDLSNARFHEQVKLGVASATRAALF